MTMLPNLFDTEHDEFRRTVRHFVDDVLAPAAENIRAVRAIPRDMWRQAGDLGLLGFMMPAEHGGGGIDDFRFNAILSQELARLGFAYASSFGINVDVVSPYLLRLATPEQRGRWFPRFCRGDLITAIALTEPGAGSDLAAMKTTAHRDGDHWLISGAKTFITNGIGCDLILVLARTGGPGARGLSMFAIDATTNGVSRGRKLDKLGQHEADTAELFFDQVRVPSSAMLGEEGAAFGYLMTNLAQERLACAIAAHACAERAFSVAMGYAKERRAFGASIGSFQHSRFELATARTELDVTAAWLERCTRLHVDGALSAADASKAKYWATEVQGRVADLGVQLFGGYGYMAESEIARIWADARVTRIFAGTSEIMREIIARDLGLRAE